MNDLPMHQIPECLRLFQINRDGPAPGCAKAQKRARGFGALSPIATALALGLDGAGRDRLHDDEIDGCAIHGSFDTQLVSKRTKNIFVRFEQGAAFGGSSGNESTDTKQ
jgi:hypothetical protein